MEFIKKNPKIYIITGKAENGKNEVAKIIKEFYENKNQKAINIAYASYLKQYAKEIINWDGNEQTKPREFLQKIGIELIQKQINNRLLIDRIIDDIRVYSYFFDIITISDARLIDEIEEIKKTNDNVTVINVYGKENKLTEEQKKHLTETGLDNYNNYDYKIKNDGNIELLKKTIYNILEVTK